MQAAFLVVVWTPVLKSSGRSSGRNSSSRRSGSGRAAPGTSPKACIQVAQLARTASVDLYKSCCTQGLPYSTPPSLALLRARLPFHWPSTPFPSLPCEGLPHPELLSITSRMRCA